MDCSAVHKSVRLDKKLLEGRVISWIGLINLTEIFALSDVNDCNSVLFPSASSIRGFTVILIGWICFFEKSTM